MKIRTKTAIVEITLVLTPDELQTLSNICNAARVYFMDRGLGEYRKSDADEMRRMMQSVWDINEDE